ncbi:PREDICTED: putative E3 ubiquitin-protein ligase LIN-1 isoform X2 [Camelina sativa]|uniref:E3 ubiquitin-protein ligase LIN-1 isoform X2 n=1 Tax=Camelina sativa TaxID=90675 RepID=A0ABM0UT03_CAMSA|nr:PREDICTED: putative E3 ubiquitin-protein ligase LIN-1 isoform X2 [Camelina sativa]
MANLSSSQSSFISCNENSSLDSIVASINDYIFRLISDLEAWMSLKHKCITWLSIEEEDTLFEFSSEHSALSNLYRGIDSIEASIQQPEWSEEKMTRLRNSERMLQMPALLDEQGTTTSGVPNTVLVAFSYFYLSIVSYLQGDSLQTTLHFLQSVLVSPEIVRTRIAPELCESIFFTPGVYKSDEEIREIARKYKYRATYYQVMSYGETHQPPSECIEKPLPRLKKYGQEIFAANAHSVAEKLELSETCELLQYQNHLHSSNDLQEDELNDIFNKIKASRKTEKTANNFEVSPCLDWNLQEDYNQELGKSARVRSLNDFLNESHLDTSSSKCVTREDIGADTLANIFCVSQQQAHKEAYNEDTLVKRSHSLIGKFNRSIIDIQAQQSKTTWNTQLEDDSSLRQLELEEISVFGHKGSITFEGMRRNLQNKKRENGLETHSRRAPTMDLWKNLQSLIKEVLGNADEKYVSEVTMIYQMLNRKEGFKYSMLKDVILDQLFTAISSSEEKTVLKASMTALTKIISVNRTALEEVKRKGLNLSHLANALKQNVQEAAILIYLIKPSPTEIKSLELLPALVDVVASTSPSSYCYTFRPSPPLLTPPAASLMIIKVLVTAFDHATNTMHLAAISSPSVLCGLLDVAKSGSSGEFISLATILVKCMQFDGLNRKYIYQHTRVAPFAHLLQSQDREEIFTALQFLHEVLKIPRSSAIKILQQMKKEGSFDIKDTLLQCIKQLQGDHKLFAADILLQLNALDSTPENKKYSNEATRALLDAVTYSEVPNMQLLSTFILSNIGGTYSWTGEPYTAAWLMKRGGLTSMSHMNMIRNINWSDDCLQDPGIDGWCCKISRRIVDTGKATFCGLQEGLKSKNRSVSKACLIAIAWLSIEISKGPNSLKYSACEVLLDEISQFLHPGLELEERLLACICIYNFSSGKGIHKLVNFSEGVRESLRRLSHVTWMADELHKATYYLFRKSDQRISCVHTQTIEMHQSGSGAVTALIYHKGLLFSGYSDGSIRVWNVNKKVATVLWDIKEHKSTVTCFSLSESGESILSGSADKTIRVWQIVKGKLDCAEVIKTKDSIRRLEAYGNMIFVITKGHKIKLLDTSRISQSIFKGKGVKSMVASQGKIYIGCIDTSIQELILTNKREKEIKAPTRSWRIQNKPINSVVVYKDMLYSSSTHVEMSNIKDLRRNYDPQMSIPAEKGSNIVAMGVVEDFIYLNRSSSANTLQIWLRRTQQKVGRLSAGSKITSLLTANDIVFCGTEAGFIKGWIPL